MLCQTEDFFQLLAELIAVMAEDNLFKGASYFCEKHCVICRQGFETENSIMVSEMGLITQ